jgi:hypothetical protein
MISFRFTIEGHREREDADVDDYSSTGTSSAHSLVARVPYSSTTVYCLAAFLLNYELPLLRMHGTL